MTDHAPLIERAFDFVPPENSYPIEPIEGSIPDYVRGRYYINGPARFTRGNLHYRHWLDGDGMVASLRFEDGGVQFTNRFVGCTRFTAEEESGAAVYRAFGTSFDGDRLLHGVALEPAINVSVHPHAGRLLAFGEQAIPWQLDPDTLETIGAYDFDGFLSTITPSSAHPRIDPATGEMFNFGISYSATRPRLNLYRFSAAGEPVYRKRLDLDLPRSIHDFGLSQSHAVVYLSPYLLNMQMLAQEGKNVQDALSWEPERGSLLLIASRETGAELARVPIGQRYCLHLVNCFEQDGLLAVDVVELDRPVYDQYQVVPDLFTDVCKGEPVRMLVDVAQGKVVERRRLGYDRAPDFPNPGPSRMTTSYRDFWMAGISATGQLGRKFFDELVHCDWDGDGDDVYRAPAATYVAGEPVFIPDPADDRAGVVIAPLFDAQSRKTTFALFDALDVKRGPIARLELRDAIPPLFHATFQAAG